MKRLDVSGDNELPELLARYLKTKEAMKQHDDVKAAIKTRFADDISAIYCDGFLAERDVRGAIRFKIVDPKVFLHD